jgi:hypothetical protein
MMETVRMDDPKLDESFSFLFAFRRGDVVVNKENRRLRGEINDGIYVGEVPSRAGGELKQRGKTLYEIKLTGELFQIVDEQEIEKVSE